MISRGESNSMVAFSSDRYNVGDTDQAFGCTRQLDARITGESAATCWRQAYGYFSESEHLASWRVDSIKSSRAASGEMASPKYLMTGWSSLQSINTLTRFVCK